MKKVLFLALFGLLVLTSCGGGGTTDTGASQEQESPAEEEAMEEEDGMESADVTGMDEIEMEVDDFYFEPAILQGEAGQELTIALHNEGDAPHTFTAKKLKVDEELQPGDETTVDITFPDSGSVKFICLFHAGQGMKGSLEVTG